MCGLVAVFEPERIFPEPLVRAMERDLIHRGPDSGGILREAGFALGFRRLAILDPTAASDQPMTDRSGQITLVFNGEIYNYRALRADLAAHGALLRSDGDTEAILEGYRLWGEAVFDRLEGMYAICLVDRDRGVALAARDPLGIKPLYMLRRGALTALASEMRPLHRLRPPEVDERALAELLVFGWAAGRLSNFRGIERIPGGTIVTVGLADARVSERRFADPLDTIEPDRSTGEAGVHDAVERSIRDHLVSDVGYTVQLSGGVDSSLVAAVAANAGNVGLKSFSVNLAGHHPYDERPFQEQVVRTYGLEHVGVEVTGADYAETLPQAISHMEGPTPHGGCTVLLLLCRTIRDASKVVLTGEGADELFGGYIRYGIWRRLALQEAIGRFLPRRLMPDIWPLRSTRRLAGLDGAAWAAVYHDFRTVARAFPGLAPAPGAREAASARFRDFRDRLFAVDQTVYLESLLVRQDKMSMAASVEARVPFAHWPLTRLVNRMSRDARAPGGATKPVLKRLAARYLPSDLIDRRKIGLWLPYEEWFADPLGAGRYLELIREPSARLAGYGVRNEILTLLDRFARGERSHGLVLQRLAEIEIWLRMATRAPEGPRDYPAEAPAVGSDEAAAVAGG